MAGRGLADKHVQADHSEVALPTVAFDYGYLGDREEECSPILCGKDRDSRWYYGILKPCKGTQDAYCAKQTTTELSLAGRGPEVGWRTSYPGPVHSGVRKARGGARPRNGRRDVAGGRQPGKRPGGAGGA